MNDIYSIGFAIYFIAPPFLLWLIAYLSADIFVLIGESRADREINRDTGVTAMGVLLGIATIAAVFTHWFSQSLEAAAFVSSVTFFLAGVVAYARVIDAVPRGSPGPQTDSVPLERALLLSAILSVCTVVPVAVVVLLASRG